MTGEEFLRQHVAEQLANLPPEEHLHRNMSGEFFLRRWTERVAEFPDDLARERRRTQVVVNRMRQSVVEWEDEFLYHDGHPRLRVYHYPFDLRLAFECRCTEPFNGQSIRLVSLRFSADVQALIARHRIRLRLGLGDARRRRALLRAERRARSLLHQFLTREQRWNLRARRAFLVKAQDGRTYEVHQGGGVRLIVDGRATTSFCIRPSGLMLPSGDLMLAQKLLLETNVEHFLATANATER